MARTLIRSATILTMDDRLGDLAGADLLVDGRSDRSNRPRHLSRRCGDRRRPRPHRDSRPDQCPHAHLADGAARLCGELDAARNISGACMPASRPCSGLRTSTSRRWWGRSTRSTSARRRWSTGATTIRRRRIPMRRCAALFDSGIRAAFFHGSPKPDPKPGQPHFSEVPHPRQEVERLLRGSALRTADGLVTLGLAILGPHYSTLDVALHDFRWRVSSASIASMHQGGGPAEDARRLGQADRSRPCRAGHQHRARQRSVRRPACGVWSISACRFR